MYIDCSKIKRIMGKDHQHIFYGYTDNNIDYLLIHDRAVKSEYEKSFMLLYNTFAELYHSRVNNNMLTRQEIELVEENFSTLLIHCKDYTAFNINKFINVFDTLDLFSIKRFPNSPISVSGVIHMYIFGTWLKYFPTKELIDYQEYTEENFDDFN